MQRFSGKKTLSLAQLDALAALAESAAAKGGGSAKPSFRRGRFVRVENPMPFDVRKAVGEGCEYFGGSVYIGQSQISVGTANAWTRIAGSDAAGTVYAIELNTEAKTAQVVVLGASSDSPVGSVSGEITPSQPDKSPLEYFPIAVVVAIAADITDIFQLYHGNLYLADVYPCNFRTDDDRSGIISAIDYSTEIQQPTVTSGAIALPCADSLANVIGGMRSVVIEEASAASAYISAGVLHLLLPPSIGGGSQSGGGGSSSGGGGSQSGGGGTPSGSSSCTCTKYIFDSEWFTTTNNADGTVTVSLNTAKLDAIADEVVNSIGVEVTATGLAESTANGNIVISTSGTASADELNASTNVSLQ